MKQQTIRFERDDPTPWERGVWGGGVAFKLRKTQPQSGDTDPGKVRTYKMGAPVVTMATQSVSHAELGEQKHRTLKISSVCGEMGAGWQRSAHRLRLPGNLRS